MVDKLKHTYIPGTCTHIYIPYNRKYWWSLAVWPQTRREKILAEFKFGGGCWAPVAYYVIISRVQSSLVYHDRVRNLS